MEVYGNYTKSIQALITPYIHSAPTWENNWKISMWYLSSHVKLCQNTSLCPHVRFSQKLDIPVLYTVQNIAHKKKEETKSSNLPEKDMGDV